jgi:hypothetical protein
MQLRRRLQSTFKSKRLVFVELAHLYPIDEFVFVAIDIDPATVLQAPTEVEERRLQAFFLAARPAPRQD